MMAKPSLAEGSRIGLCRRSLGNLSGDLDTKTAVGYKSTAELWNY
jgi:hypothetical protein